MPKGHILEIIEKLKHSDEQVRLDAVKAIMTISNLGDKRAVEPLIELMKDKNEKIRINVINSLWRIGDERALNPLKEALKDENE